MTPRIENAIEVLIEAVNKNQLTKGVCQYCVVGNLVAASGITDMRKRGKWSRLFITDSENDIQHLGDENNRTPEEIQEAIDTLYYVEFTLDELATIEKTFETNTHIPYRNYRYVSNQEIHEDQMKGLEAVVQVMLDFDDCKEYVQDVFSSHILPVEKRIRTLESRF